MRQLRCNVTNTVVNVQYTPNTNLDRPLQQQRVDFPITESLTSVGYRLPTVASAIERNNRLRKTRAAVRGLLYNIGLHGPCVRASSRFP